MPSGVVTLASAVSEVNGIVFCIATFFGKIPSIALEVLVCYQVISIKGNYINLIMAIIGLVMIFFTIKHYKS